jgi:hypothetical protein
MTGEQAIVLGLLNAFMWGSWAVFIRKLDGYPLDAFFVTLYICSFVLVWGIALIVQGGAVLAEIGEAWQQQPSLVLVTLIAGAVFVMGVRITISVFSRVGLTITAPVQTLMNLGLGTALAAWVGGVPPGISLADLGVVCLFFLLASLATMWASEVRNRARNTGSVQPVTNSRLAFLRIVLMVALSSAIVTSYPLGLSFALRTPEHDTGLTPLPYMALLATGSLASVLLVCGGRLTLRRQWQVLFGAGWATHRYAVVTSFAHYGGNIINAFATGVLTTAISWPLGTTSQLWTYVWGLASGEFRGAPRLSYLLLLVGGVLFVVGILFLRWALVR